MTYYPGLHPLHRLGNFVASWAFVADKTSVVSADKTFVVSADKISVVSADKISQDISMVSTTQGLRPCVVDKIEMSWETTDVLSADTTDILSADTTDVLSADTTDVWSAGTSDG